MLIAKLPYRVEVQPCIIWHVNVFKACGATCQHLLELLGLHV